MTKEESSKAYNKALEAARKEISVYRKEHPVLERVLYNIFPELSENEDERIRKGLVNFLQSPFIKDNKLRTMKKEQIEHWATIVSAVFRAEEAIKHDWLPKLRKAKDATPEERQKIADGYCRAIAVEILSHSEDDIQSV